MTAMQGAHLSYCSFYKRQTESDLKGYRYRSRFLQDVMFFIIIIYSFNVLTTDITL